MSEPDWRMCDHCGHRFIFRMPYSLVVPDPNDEDENGNMRQEQWCPVCLREDLMKVSNWWQML